MYYCGFVIPGIQLSSSEKVTWICPRQLPSDKDACQIPTQLPNDKDACQIPTQLPNDKDACPIPMQLPNGKDARQIEKNNQITVLQKFADCGQYKIFPSFSHAQSIHPQMPQHVPRTQEHQTE